MIFFFKKKDVGLRLCINYRGLNKITIKNLIFSKLSPNCYSLVHIREVDEWKNAFITPIGLWVYLLMPSGLCNSPAVFQHLVNNVICEILMRWVFVYLDDILIYSRSD